jgi:hypothetical protein
VAGVQIKTFGYLFGERGASSNKELKLTKHGELRSFAA